MDVSNSYPDMEKFPCLSLAYEKRQRLGVRKTVALNAADEVAVAEHSIQGRIGFDQILK